MASSTSTMTTTDIPNIIPPHHFDKLRSILWTANQKHFALAAFTRCNLSLTHWARARAHKLGLRVNTRRAKECPQQLISIEPLPMLELCSTPLLPAMGSLLLGVSPVKVASSISTGSSASSIGLGYAGRRRGGGVPTIPSGGVSSRASMVGISIPAAPLMRSLELPSSSSTSSGERSVWEDDMEFSSGDESESSWSSGEDESDSIVLTPEDKTVEPIMIRIKRKTIELEEEYDQCKRVRFIQ